MRMVCAALAVIGSVTCSLAAIPVASASMPTPVPSALTPALPHGTTRLATVLHTVTGYAWPGRHAVAKVPATWYGYHSVLPVVAMTPGWVRVRLAQRPDGSMAWIPAADVTLGSTPYAVVIDVKTMHLALYDQGSKVFSAPAGVGAPDDPTPRGQFFVAFVESPPVPNDGYGPFIIVTSAHSNAIKNWEGSGDAVMGIHGPLGEDREIGATGARISHGCIRLHLSALRRLSAIPAGTPVTVIAS